jgi:hypothetical protein
MPIEAPVVSQMRADAHGLTVEYENTLDDVIAFSVHVNQTSPALRLNLRLRWGVAAVACVILLAATLVLQSFMPNRGLFVGLYAIIMGLLLLTYSRRYRTGIRRLHTRLYREGANRTLVGPRRLTLTPEFVDYATPLSQSMTRWLGVEKVEVTDQALYIYLSSFSGISVPRRAFVSTEEFEQFANRAKELQTAAQRSLA